MNTFIDSSVNSHATYTHMEKSRTSESGSNGGRSAAVTFIIFALVWLLGVAMIAGVVMLIQGLVA